jgi:hypothetical protein
MDDRAVGAQALEFRREVRVVPRRVTVHERIDVSAIQLHELERIGLAGKTRRHAEKGNDSPQRRR